MQASSRTGQPVPYVVGCAAPPVLRVRVLVEVAQARGWNTCLVLTPAEASWLETSIAPLADLTGRTGTSGPPRS